MDGAFFFAKIPDLGRNRAARCAAPTNGARSLIPYPSQATAKVAPTVAEISRRAADSRPYGQTPTPSFFFVGAGHWSARPGMKHGSGTGGEDTRTGVRTPVIGVRGKATMSTKCSSEPIPIPSVLSGHLPLIRGVSPGGVLGHLPVPPGEAQRSGFAGKRRSKGAVAVFAAKRKRRQVDFATTSRRGQSHSPPAGGETPFAANRRNLERRSISAKRV